MAASPEMWLGPDHLRQHGLDPVLLVKLLDAGERLPVHVHPDDRFAREHLSCPAGKTEAWIVLHADPGARVHLGFREHVERERLAGWVADQERDSMLQALHAVDVKMGDTVYVPAGLPHAIGEGILLVELQQASDLSLLLEYSGFALDGPRDGHLGVGFDTALQCVRRGAVSGDELDRLRGRWDDEHIFPPPADAFFRVQRLAGLVDDALAPGFLVLVVVRGTGKLTWQGHEDGLYLPAGSTVVVPHGVGVTRLHGELEALSCRPPQGEPGL